MVYETLFHTMVIIVKKKYNKDEQTLLDVYKKGERVVQVYYDLDGLKKEHSGVIVKIKPHCMAIYWDTIDGKPISNIQETYAVLHEMEILKGSKNSSAIKKEKNNSI